ncbi:methyltransferase domain-containing protein [Stemphylium lycopersici]|uniref:Methyltransferase domain-containing protein n=1 Tax=Stemphylium lycopersici TaxID=183478 RepID=A0A364NGT4_STELY|nr:methyltransferase protein [Stemphylium lycopersici]RAR09802.1 methyltransferase domain-containing protein [Stemphylium lycopersici]RAR16480.1 methyltransferase domain-containing protein [Stemphylium lycopersici]
MTDQLSTNLKARIKASYDAIAPKYAQEFTNPDDELRLDYLNRLLTLLQSSANNKNNNDSKAPTASVLELGCGAGIPATKILLSSTNPTINVTGNDISTTQLTLARTNLSEYSNSTRLTLLDGDMLSLAFPPASFNAITAFYSIIHLPRAEQTQLVSKIADWLKPGGYLLANFSAAAMENLEKETWLGHERGWMFWSGWGEQGSVAMVEEAGFKVLVREVRKAVGDEAFVWVLARKEGGVE